jgi:hypothetical protein
MKTCADCETVVSKLVKDRCRPCYQYWYLTDNPDKPRCTAEDLCSLPQNGKSPYCHIHKKRFDRGATNSLGVGRGRPGILRGRSNMQGRYVNADGYVKIRLPDIVGDKAWVLEHRHVMEQSLGRKLLKGENVHHKDGNKENNDPTNLELWVSFQPAGQRPEDLLAYAYEIIERYGK